MTNRISKKQRLPSHERSLREGESMRRTPISLDDIDNARHDPEIGMAGGDCDLNKGRSRLRTGTPPRDQSDF